MTDQLDLFEEGDMEEFNLTYEELQEAIVMYLRHNGDLEENEFVVSTDIPVDLNDKGLFVFGVEVGEHSG